MRTTRATRASPLTPTNRQVACYSYSQPEQTPVCDVADLIVAVDFCGLCSTPCSPKRTRESPTIIPAGCQTARRRWTAGKWLEGRGSVCCSRWCLGSPSFLPYHIYVAGSSYRIFSSLFYYSVAQMTHSNKDGRFVGVSNCPDRCNMHGQCVYWTTATPRRYHCECYRGYHVRPPCLLAAPMFLFPNISNACCRVRAAKR